MSKREIARHIRNIDQDGRFRKIGWKSDPFTQVNQDSLLNQPGMQPLRRDLL